MAFLEKVKNFFSFSKKKEEDDFDKKDKKVRESLGLERVGNGSIRSWTASRVDQVRAYKHWTYVAITTIAEKIASQKPNLGLIKIEDQDYEVPDAKVLARQDRLRQKALTPINNLETVELVRQNHPIQKLLDDPNEPDTAYDVWYETVLFLLLTGNAYWWVPRNNLGIPVAIWVLPAHWVWPIYGKTKLVEYYEIRPVEGEFLRKAFPADEIIHFKRKSPISKIDGYSPLTAGDNWIDTSNSIDRSRNYQFMNGAFPSTVLEFDPNYSDPSFEDLERIEMKFMKRYSGEIKNGKPLLLPPGVKFHNISVHPREMDFCESADQMRNNILALFKVPHAVVGISDKMTYGSNLAADSQFCNYCINPLFRYLGQVLSEKLARKVDKNLRIWWEDCSPEDPTVVENRLKTDMSLGAITPNELRIIRGRKPYNYGGENPILPNMGIILPYGNGKEETLISTKNSNKQNNNTEEPELENQEPKEEEE